MSTAETVRTLVSQRPERAFIPTTTIPGSRRAVECEMSRLASEGEVLRVRKGLYWKAAKTRVGMALPRPAEIALAVAGPGAGLAGVSAAHALGLTTQVPAVEEIAVAGRVPSPVRGARFTSRSIERRLLGLRPTEIALLEVLRAGPSVIDVPWAQVASTAKRLAAAGEIRCELLATQTANEHHVATRQRWIELGLGETTQT
jgi:hypothetical protein